MNRNFGISPSDWNALENIAAPLKIPKYTGLFEGVDYRGHGEGFLRFVEDHIYDVDRSTGQYAPFKFTPEQREILLKAFEADEDGILKHITVLFSWPRRHGKTQHFSYYDIYRALNYRNQRVTIGSNSAAQSKETAYSWVVETLLNSPALRKQVDAGLIRITRERVEFLVTGSKIESVTSAAASAYGRKISVAHLTELHEAPDRALYDALASSVLDSKDGVVLADSTVGDRDNIVWNLIEIADEGADPSLFVSYISYDSLAVALEKSPQWIDRKALIGRKSQMMEPDFRRYHLNKPTSGAETMLQRDEWQACILPNVHEPLDTRYLEKEVVRRMQNSGLHFGAGLDRAQSYSKNPDRTVLTLVAKGFLKPELMQGVKADGPADMAEYWVMDSVEIDRSDDRMLKRYLEEWHRKYRLSSFAPERYETDDLSRWAERTLGIQVEPAAPTHTNQRDAVDMVYRAVLGKRFYLPSALWLLIYEGYNFAVDYSKAQPHFGHRKAFKVTVDFGEGRRQVWIKDDAFKSLMWAIWGLRRFDSPPVRWTDCAPLMPDKDETAELMDSYMEDF